MLVMRRRPGDSFTVGEDVEIEILEVTGTRVKLGIKAPDSCIIMRKEVRVTRDQNVSASRSVDRETIQSLLRGLYR
jgi:carbon storage regulator